jgi:hypothetical protein
MKVSTVGYSTDCAHLSKAHSPSCHPLPFLATFSFKRSYAGQCFTDKKDTGTKLYGGRPGGDSDA